MSGHTWQQGLELIKQGQFQEAEQVLRAVVGADDLSFEGHFYLGAAQAKQRRYEEAAASLSSAVNILPDHVGAHYNLGIALEQAGDVQGATNEYQTALQLNPEHTKAGQRLQGLEAQQAAQRRQAVAAATPGSWMSDKQDEPVYSEQELEVADRAAAREQGLVRSGVLIAWGIGIASLFIAFSQVMGVIYGSVVVLPLLGPLIYLVAMDANDWFSVNPKLAIPVSAVGVVFSAAALIWAIKAGAFGG